MEQEVNHTTTRKRRKSSEDEDLSLMTFSSASTPILGRSLVPNAYSASSISSSSISSSMNLQLLHQRQLIESLQAELDYERNRRQIDERSHQAKVSRLQQTIEFATAEANEAKELLKMNNEQSQKRILTLTNERDEALKLHRQLQFELIHGRKNRDHRHPEKDEESDEEEERDDDVFYYRTECERLNSQIQAQIENEAKYRQEIEQFKETTQKRLQDVKERRLEQEEEKIAETPTASLLVKDNDVPPAIVPAELHKVRVQLADTQRENRQLQRQLAQAQQRQAESVGLQEKCNLLQKRLQNLADQHAKLNAQYEESRAVTNAWKELGTKLPSMLCSSNSSSSAAAASSLAGPPEAVAILRYFENAELEIQLAQEQAQMYKTELEAWRKQKEQAGTSAVVDGDDNSVESLQQQVRDYQIQQEKIQNQLILAQQQSSLYQRETESLRALIKTFEYQIETKQPVQLADATLHVRVDTIQQELANLQNAYDTVLKELEVVRTEKSKQGVELDRVREKFVKIREALENEKVKATKAQERAVLAEQLAGKGSFDPQRTRVMHFTETPLVMALKEEISVLKRQLELAANSQQQALTGGSLAPDAEKLNQRLKETFRDQIATFREGVYLMTGFKIDMLSGTERPTFRLRSVFAEREQDHLVLQYPTTTADRKVSSLDILQTDFARILTTEPSYDYVRKFHSIPAFLSSVQLSLFEKQTVML